MRGGGCAHNPKYVRMNYSVGEVVQLLERIQSAALFSQPGGSDAAGVDICAAARAVTTVKRIYSLAPPGAASTSGSSSAVFPPPAAPVEAASRAIGPSGGAVA